MLIGHVGKFDRLLSISDTVEVVKQILIFTCRKHFDES